MVRLVPMNPTEFEVYLESSVQEYAQEHVRAGNMDKNGVRPTRVGKLSVML